MSKYLLFLFIYICNNVYSQQYKDSFKQFIFKESFSNKLLPKQNLISIYTRKDTIIYREIYLDLKVNNLNCNIDYYYGDTNVYKKVFYSAIGKKDSVYRRYRDIFSISNLFLCIDYYMNLKIKQIDLRIKKTKEKSEELLSSFSVKNNKYTNTKIENDSFYYNSSLDVKIKLDSTNKLLEFSIDKDKFISLNAGEIPKILDVDAKNRIHFCLEYHTLIEKQQLYNFPPVPTLLDGYEIKEIRLK